MEPLGGSPPLPVATPHEQKCKSPTQTQLLKIISINANRTYPKGRLFTTREFPYPARPGTAGKPICRRGAGKKRLRPPATSRRFCGSETPTGRAGASLAEEPLELSPKRVSHMRRFWRQGHSNHQPTTNASTLGPNGQ